MTDSTSSAPLGMLPVTCGRRRKIVNLKMPVSSMESYIKNSNTRERNGRALLESLEKFGDGELPDLVVIYRGQAFVLPTVVEDEKQDLAVKRALNTALGADAETTFYDVPASIARGPKTKNDDATGTGESVENSEATS